MHKKLINVRVDDPTLALLEKAVLFSHRSQSDILRDAISLGLEMLMSVKKTSLELIKEEALKLEHNKTCKNIVRE